MNRKATKRRRAKAAEPPARVYPAEKDPRQDAVRGYDATLFFDRSAVDSSTSLAAEFGPWVRDEDGRWARRTSK